MAHKHGSKRKKGVEGTEGRGRGRLVILGAGGLVAVGIVIAMLSPFSAPPAVSNSVPEATYSLDVAPILQENCIECHRPGGLGPFSLMTYEDAKDNAQIVKESTAARRMPPWRAAEGYGEFRNDRRLTRSQIDTIGRWADGGTPEGDLRDLPPPRQFVQGWRLGTPDLVLDAGADYRVRPSGGDFFRSFVLPFNPKEDVWVSAIEVLAGTPGIVHHLGIYIDPLRKSQALDKADPGLGYSGDAVFMPNITLDFWTPGSTPRFLEPGTAWRIPANSLLVMDIHYTPDGQLHMDRTRIGLHFAKGPIDKRVRFGAVGNQTFKIPAGADHYEVTANRKLPIDIHLVSGWPHMHYLGKEMKVWATLPGDAVAPLVWVPDYDLHWQTIYVLKDPLALPRGARIQLTAYYDNSAANPENPHPKPRDIYFGQRAKDEMCFFYFNYTVDAEHLTKGQVVDPDGLELRIGSGG